MKNGTNRRKYMGMALPVYLLLLLILADAFLAPYLESRMLPESRLCYAALQHICHQAPTRCFWIFGSNMALCARCFGIFLSLFLAGLILGWSAAKKIRWKTALFLLLPALIDGTAGLFGWWKSSNTVRFLSGLMAGTGGALALFPMYFAFFSGLILMLRKKQIAVE